MDLPILKLNRGLQKNDKTSQESSAVSMGGNISENDKLKNSFASDHQTNFNVGLVQPTVYWVYYDTNEQKFYGNFPETWTIIKLGDGLVLLTHQLGNFNYSVNVTPSFLSRPTKFGPIWRSDWEAETFYQVDDVVMYLDVPYIAIQNNVNHPPNVIDGNWSPMLENVYQAFNSITFKGLNSFFIHTIDTNGDPVDLDFSCVIFSYPL